ncbi:hypothetical protein D3C75_785410 [compost metagenome]
MLLGDLQRQVGAAGQQAGLRVGPIDFRQLVQRLRQQAAPLATLQRGIALAGDDLQRGQGFGFMALEAVGLSLCAGLFGGGDDRPVAGAAAQVAGQRIDRLRAVVSGAALLQGKQRHDETRCAEAALAAVAVGHRLLHAMQMPRLTEILDGDQLLAVQGGHEGQAGVQAAIAQPRAVGGRVRLGDHHGAGTAVARRTALLGAAAAEMAAQVFEHRQIRIERGLAAQLAVEQKLDHGGPLPRLVR